MELSKQGAAFIRKHEGFVDHWYNDPVGIPTVGIGFTERSGAFRTWWKQNRRGEAFGYGRMTRAEADDALVYLCRFEYGSAVNRFLGREVPQHVFDGMVSPVYNLGPGALKWKWAAACKAGHFQKGATLLRTTGTTARGIRLAGLVRRRIEEASLLEHANYTPVTLHDAPDAMVDGILRRGERGSAVRKLIVQLEVLGHYFGVMDDVFGPGLEAAVMDFQRKEGLKVDGIAGPATLGAIKGKVVPKPKPTPKVRKADKVTIAALLTAAFGFLAIKWHEFTAWVCEILPFCQ